MAFQPQLTNYIRSIPAKNVRFFAAAAAKPKEAASSTSTANPYFVPEEPVQTTKESGVTVTTQERNKPLALLSVTYKAGSRFENESNLGIAHLVRIAAGLGTSGMTRFGMARVIEQAGGNFFCTAGREHISYTIEATRDKIEDLAQILVEASAKQAFKHWEVTDALPRQKYELQMLSPEVKVLELIHKAAFRKGLGNSLYSPGFAVGKYSTAELSDFVSKNFVEASVCGIGVSSEIANKTARRLKLKPAERQLDATKFSADQIRKEKGGDLAYVALAIQGGGLNNSKDMVAAALAQRALGVGSRAKRGNIAGKLSTVNSENSVVSSFSNSYSDAGLLGVFIVGTPAGAAGVTKKAADILRNTSFSEDDVKRAKNILKADLALALETDTGRLDEMGLQSLYLGRFHSTEDVNKQIDAVTAADVNAVIKKGSGKLAMAAFGNIGKVPYLDEL